MTARIYVPDETTACSLGADGVAAAVSRQIERHSLDAELVRNGSRGAFHLEPLVEVATSAQAQRIAFANVSPADALALFDGVALPDADHARSLGYPASVIPARLEGDAVAAGRAIIDYLADKPDGIYLWGGETTVKLPARHGRGGRCQSLALAAAREMQGQESLVLLAAGTDGTDGPGGAAGAMVDPETVPRGIARGLDARHCLDAADAGNFLAASGDLLVTGPTGTNVTDLVVALKGNHA